MKSVNKELIELYWRVGEHVSKKISSSEWGKGVIQKLAEYLSKNVPESISFSARNIWRMKQFYEEYQGITILSPLVTELSWTNNLLILSRCKTEQHIYECINILQRVY